MEDHTAIVECDIEPYSRNVKRYYQSEIISKIDTLINDTYRVRFKIDNIDSLGNYLPSYPKKFQFSFKKKTFNLIETDLDLDSSPSCCHVTMEIVLENQIIEFHSKNNSANQKTTHSIFIERSKRQIRKGIKKLDLEATTIGQENEIFRGLKTHLFQCYLMISDTLVQIEFFNEKGNQIFGHVPPIKLNSTSKSSKSKLLFISEQEGIKVSSRKNSLKVKSAKYGNFKVFKTNLTMEAIDELRRRNMEFQNRH